MLVGLILSLLSSYLVFEVEPTVHLITIKPHPHLPFLEFFADGAKAGFYRGYLKGRYRFFLDRAEPPPVVNAKSHLGGKSQRRDPIRGRTDSVNSRLMG